MRRVVVLLALLALALPMAAWADTITLTNEFGSISISAAGITSRGSQLSSFNGITAPAGHALGSVSFSVGALTSGSIRWGGTFSSSGSWFTVMGIGKYGEPKGTIFNGSFVGPVDWTLTSAPGIEPDLHPQRRDRGRAVWRSSGDWMDYPEHLHY